MFCRWISVEGDSLFAIWTHTSACSYVQASQTGLAMNVEIEFSVYFFFFFLLASMYQQRRLVWDLFARVQNAGC